MKTKTKIHDDTELYMVIYRISGNVNNRKIDSYRGDVIRLNSTEYNIFKDSVLLIPREILK